jgi:CheY-like chemotaxis protein
VTVAAPQILLVDDNPTNLQVLYQTLEGQGYRLLAARSGKDAITIAERAAPDLILLDVLMPEIDGYETCARLKADARTRDCAIIFLSALNDARDRAHGLDLGAVDFVNKPFQAEEILARVKTHLTIRELQQQLRQHNTALQHELTVAQELLREARDRTDGVLLGESAAAVQLRHHIREAAGSDENWLINGPPGSDHEAVARAIHHQSARATRAIIVVNCLSLTSDSASGRAGTHADLFDKLPLANGGTLYIEGVEHLPPEAQVTLVERLRALDAARTAAIRSDVDVRVLVSTTRDVDEAVASGRVIPELRRALPSTLGPRPAPRPASTISRSSHRTSFVVRPSRPDVRCRSCPRNRSSVCRTTAGQAILRELRNVLGFALSTSQGAVLEIGEQLLDNNLRVGSYSLIERLGSGGMGDVWLARHQLLARPAAVKIIREAALGGGEDGHIRRQRFAREAQRRQSCSPHTPCSCMTSASPKAAASTT